MERTGRGWADLHVHSAFSLLDGASRPEALAARAAELGYPALALTDHDSLAGLVAHAQACAAHGLRPIAGVELTLEDGTHLILLARDALGYRSLCRLVSTAQLVGAKGRPHATLADVAACSAGLECLTGCRTGAVAAALLRGDEEGARRALTQLLAIFGAAHTHIEVQRSGLSDDGRLSFALARLAHATGLPLVATGNAHYACAGDRDLQDVLVCLRERVPLARARPFLRDGAAWCLRAPAEMAQRFRDLPVALEGAVRLAERCAFDLAHVDASFPAFAVPIGQTQDGYLAEIAWQGARERFGAAADMPEGTVAGRLRHELGVIAGLGLASYILTVWDIVLFAREQGILCQGRGSAVGSLVCYCLGITAVDPLAHGLSFERFLSVSRTDPPDIDVDFPSDRDGAAPAREAVLRYVLERYQGHAALVPTHVTFRARSSLREVGMALDLARDQLDALSEAVEHAPGGAHALESTRAVQRLLLPSGPQVRRIIDLCARLDGLPRHLGQHPGGVVITARPLAEVAPLEHARMEGRIVTQWDKDGAEAVGLAKIDLLGLGMLLVLDRCFALLEEQTGTRPALHSFRCDDARIYDAFCRADTVGVFQLESRAQMSACLPHLQPRCYADLIVAVALIRPGPVQGNAVHPYLRRRRGLEPVTYPGGAAGQRLLEPVLGETLGVCLFQDQVIGIARAAGLSPDEAAEVRRAMSSARGPERMAALRGRLDAGLAAHGLDAAGRATVLDMVQAFSGYGFLKGHAAAFAYLSYVSCWLKIHHPAIFLAGLLNCQPMGYYSPEVLVDDAKRHGVRVLPMDLWKSRTDCTLEGGAVRLGWRLVAGLGPDACARLELARAAWQEQPDLETLCVQARLEEDEVRALARAGALRTLYPSRRQALWQAPLVARAARARWLPGTLAGLDPHVQLPEATTVEELALDRAALGLSLGGHVLSHLRPELARRRLPRIADLAHLPTGLVIDLPGQVLSRDRPATARGVTFLSLSDETGMVTVVLLPPVYMRDRTTVRGEILVWVRGVVEREGGALAVRAKRIFPLSALLARALPVASGHTHAPAQGTTRALHRPQSVSIHQTRGGTTMTTTRIGLVVARPTPTAAVEAIIRAEEHAVPAVWSTVGGTNPDALTMFAAAAVRTQHILLGTSIVPVYPRHPLALASQALALADLAPGRFRLGIGSSHRPTIEGMYGLPFAKPLSYLREYLTVLRHLLWEGRVDVAGEFFTVKAELPAGMASPRTPLLISALRTGSFHMAGEIADGAISWVCPVPYLVGTALPALRAGAEAAGRPVPPLIAHVPVALSTDRDGVRAAARRRLAMYGRLPFYAHMFADAGHPVDPDGTLPDALLDELVVAGDAPQVAARLAAIQAQGLDELLVMPVPVADADAEEVALLDALREGA